VHNTTSARTAVQAQDLPLWSNRHVGDPLIPSK